MIPQPWGSRVGTDVPGTGLVSTQIPRSALVVRASNSQRIAVARGVGNGGLNRTAAFITQNVLLQKTHCAILLRRPREQEPKTQPMNVLTAKQTARKDHDAPLNAS